MTDDDQRGGTEVWSGGQCEPVTVLPEEPPEYAYEDSPAVRLWVSFHEPKDICNGRDTVEVTWRDAPTMDELLTVLDRVLNEGPRITRL